MARAYLWKRRPKDDEAMRRKIARCLGTTVDGFRDIIGRYDGVPVRVTVAQVYRHNWKDRKGARWDQVPMIRPAIENAYAVRGEERQRGQTKDRLYPIIMTVGYRGEPGKLAHVATYVKEKGRGRTWKSTILIEDDRKTGRAAAERLAAMERAAGSPLKRRNSHSYLATRNPTPVQTPPGVSRSGRTPTAYKHNTPSADELSRKGLHPLFFLAVGLLALGYLARQPQELAS